MRAHHPRTGPASAASVVHWRRRRLIAAGFTPPLAAELARDGAVDLHAVLELIDRGCPPPLAARILAPLEPADRGLPAPGRAGDQRGV